MNQKEVDEIIEKHKHYLAQDCEGWENMKADFTNADIFNVVFEDVDLSKVSFKEANLAFVNFNYCTMQSVNFSKTNLREVSFYLTDDLSRSYFVNAFISECDFDRCDMSRVYMVNAIIVNSTFIHTNLTNANLGEATIRNCSLCWANFAGANADRVLMDNVLTLKTNFGFASHRLFTLSNVGYADPYDKDYTYKDAIINYNAGMTCPDTGSFVGWKKAINAKTREVVIVKLLITENAKRVGNALKCRCSEAKVLGFETIDGKEITDDITVRSWFDQDFIYPKGEIISVDKFDENRWDVCSTGIHFFINRCEAVNFEDIG